MKLITVLINVSKRYFESLELTNSVTFTVSNAHMPEAQLFSVSYILTQHVTIEPMRLMFYPAFLLNVEPTARRDASLLLHLFIVEFPSLILMKFIE